MLYQTARPKTLDEMNGNPAAKAAIANALASADRPHSYLLAGPSGCGKTTLARIMADGLGCVGGYMVELNAADRRGIEDIRAVLRDSSCAPFGGSSRVFIIDECHMLTKEAQNAVLKALEDTPPYQYYILCSTDPQKLLPTIRTRCARVDLLPLSEGDMIDMLLSSVERAGVACPADAVLAAIATAADGSSRQALVMLEQAVGLPEDKALEVIHKHDAVQKELIELCRAVVNRRSWQEVIGIYKALAEKDPEAVRRCLLGYLRSCLMGNGGNRFCAMIEALAAPTYDGGEPLLIAMLWRAWSVV